MIKHPKILGLSSAFCNEVRPTDISFGGVIEALFHCLRRRCRRWPHRNTLSQARRLKHPPFRSQVSSRSHWLMHPALQAASLILGLSTTPACASGPYVTYSLQAVVFDDGGEAQGSFDFHMLPFGLPQFFNFTVETNAGALLTGSTFTASNYCWINDKQPLCAPGDDLLVTLANGISAGQTGYDAFQFAGWYAPNATPTVVLDKAVSYEIRCDTPSSCLVRHVISGTFTMTGRGRD